MLLSSLSGYSFSMANGGGQGSVNDGAVGGSWRSKTRMMMLEEIRRCFAPFLF
jgi:hypothetical protein